MDDARQWADTALRRRPERREVMAALVADQQVLQPVRVLELGSGLGFLASQLPSALSRLQMGLLELSAVMHGLACRRLAGLAVRARFVQRSFLDADCNRGLGTVDAMVPIQAVHELRRKRRAVALHVQVRAVLGPGGQYLVADHVAGPTACVTSACS